jgi:PleD family two-component response regulator
VEEAKRQLVQQDLEAQLSDGLVGLQNYSYFCYLNACL